MPFFLWSSGLWQRYLWPWLSTSARNLWFGHLIDATLSWWPLDMHYSLGLRTFMLSCSHSHYSLLSWRTVLTKQNFPTIPSQIPVKITTLPSVPKSVISTGIQNSIITLCFSSLFHLVINSTNIYLASALYFPTLEYGTTKTRSWWSETKLELGNGEGEKEATGEQEFLPHGEQ